MDVGPKRDLVGDLADAVRDRGLRMGLYYSLIEWETTKTGRTASGRFIPEEVMESHSIPLPRYVDDHVLPQLRELVTEYEPALIFADGGEWDHDEEFWRTKDFLAWLYNHAPNRDEVVVNDRWAKGMPGHHGDYFSSEYQDAEGVGTEHPWEESRGMGRSYGYNRAETIDHYRTSKELVHELIDVVSRGGNLLLNVGPTADGRIPVIMQQRLRDIGTWLDVNGEAIFGTRPWRTGASDAANDAVGPIVRFTRKGSDLFVHLLEWPDGPVRIEGVSPRDGFTIGLMGFGGSIEWQQEGGSILITPPQMSPADVPVPYAYVFKITNALN
jgi:alpha-L-fucosidase